MVEALRDIHHTPPKKRCFIKVNYFLGYRRQAAVSVRLMKRDLLFINTQLAELVGEGRLETVAKQHGPKRSKDTENIGKLFAA